MRTLIQAVAGLSLVVIGTAKAMAHTATSDPMAAFWCRSSDLIAGTQSGASMTWLSGHCWGCPVALAGAALVLAAGVSALRSMRRDGRFVPAI